MAVDLGDLLETLQRAVNPPGQTIFADATTGDYEGYLSDSFWELTLRGYISGYTAVDTIVTPNSGSDELSRELQQLIVTNAAMNILRIQLLNIETTFRAKAGSVEYETGRSANAISAVLDSLQKTYDDILDGLPSDNEGHPIYYGDVGLLRGGYGDFSFKGY